MHPKKKQLPTSPQTPPTDQPKLPEEDDVVAYANQCKKELGLSPEILAPWNCLEGKEIPFTINGKILDENNYRDLAVGKVACDHPAWLQPLEACINYAFIQERNLAPEVKAVMVCRARNFRSHTTREERRTELQNKPTITNFLSYYQLNSVGLIWTHMKTGKTCFFDFRGVYGGYIPSPDDEKFPSFSDLPNPKFTNDSNGEALDPDLWKLNARTAWKSPRYVGTTDQCVKCHDTGPFISTPWLKQVYSPPRNAQNVPYQVIGAAFDRQKYPFPVLSVSTLPIRNPDGSETAQICTDCHRIGIRHSCERFIDYSIGQQSPLAFPTDAPLPQIWMPPDMQKIPATTNTNTITDAHHDTNSKTIWDTKYKAHVDRLKCCCAHPNALNCLSQDITQVPIPSLSVGHGPEVCN